MNDLQDLPGRPDAAIRLLHTSDWHLGVTVRSEPRAEDHDAVIAEIVAIASAAEPDLIVHTGDLFDGARPPMVEFGRAIRALRALAEVAPVVLLAGNHDSSAALEVLGLALHSGLGDASYGVAVDPHTPTTERIRVIARPVRADQGAVATYQTRAGGALRLVAMPFVHQNRVIRDFADIVEANATYNDSLRKIISSYGKVCFDDFDPSRDVAVFASHVHIRDAKTSTEKTIHIAEDYATDPAHFDPGYGYLAFGHIHVPQAVAAGRGRYAGSILEVDFGEEGEAKQVGIVDLIPGRPAAVHSVELTAGRRIHRVRAPLSALATHADNIGTGIVEVTISPELDAEGDPIASDRIAIDDVAFDTLSAAVVSVLPDAAVVSVIDARSPVSVLADLPSPSGTESLSDSFRTWLASDSASGPLGRPDAKLADPARVAEMFDECHAAAMLDAEVELAEVAELAAMQENA